MTHRFSSNVRQFLLAAVTLAVLLAFPVGALSSPAIQSASTHGRQIDPPSVTAKSVFSFDLTTGITMYEKDANEHMQIGSTTKVATALVALKLGNTDDEVTIDESDTVDIAVESNMGLQAGDTLTLGTLLYGLLLPSGNDAANAIARHVGTSMCDCTNANDARAAFVQAMNDYARELGLTDTRFTNPSGMDSDQMYSSAHDVAKLFGAFIQDERLANIASQPAYSFYSVGPEKRHYTANTTDRLLGQMGVIGAKTGTTGAAGACVVAAREMNNGSNIVITAVLGADVTYDNNTIVEGSDKRWDDISSVFAAMDKDFSWVQAGTEGTFPGLTEEMAVWQVQFRDAPLVPYPAEGVETTYQLMLAPDGKDGGKVELFYNTEAVGSVPVYYATSAYVRKESA